MKNHSIYNNKGKNIEITMSRDIFPVILFAEYGKKILISGCIITRCVDVLKRVNAKEYG